MRKNGRRNIFMTKSSQKNVPYAGIDLGTACILSGIASDRETVPGLHEKYMYHNIRTRNIFRNDNLQVLSLLLVKFPHMSFTPQKYW